VLLLLLGVVTSKLLLLVWVVVIQLLLLLLAYWLAAAAAAAADLSTQGIWQPWHHRCTDAATSSNSSGSRTGHSYTLRYCCQPLLQVTH
jgi:ABC-type antimicrobial peptide transport system permease subunit